MLPTLPVNIEHNVFNKFDMFSAIYTVFSNVYDEDPCHLKSGIDAQIGQTGMRTISRHLY